MRRVVFAMVFIYKSPMLCATFLLSINNLSYMTGSRKKLKGTVEKSIFIPPDVKASLCKSIEMMDEKKLAELKDFFRDNDERVGAIEKKYGKIKIPKDLKVKGCSKKRCAKGDC
jgi:hypothetical protein